MAFVDHILLLSFLRLLLLFSSIVLSSGSCWHHVQTTAASKEAFSCDEDLMCSSHGTNGICLPPLLLFPYSAGEGGGLVLGRGLVLIHHFLKVLVLVS